MDLAAMETIRNEMMPHDGDDAYMVQGQGSVRFAPQPFGQDVHRIDGRQLDLNALMMAKAEYMAYLNSILSRGVREGLIAQHETAIKQSACYAAEIDTYQRVLRQTKLWNSQVIAKETERVLGKNMAIFPNLLAALYVAQVKILASVRVTKGASTVQITIPSNEAFVHAVYVECARILFSNPLLIYVGNDLSPRKVCERNVNVDRVVADGIVEAVRIMLPVRDILYEYLQGTMLQNTVFSMGDDFEAYMQTPYTPAAAAMAVGASMPSPPVPALMPAMMAPQMMPPPPPAPDVHAAPEPHVRLPPPPAYDAAANDDGDGDTLSVPQDPIRRLRVPPPPVQRHAAVDPMAPRGPDPKVDAFQDDASSDDGSGSEIPSDLDDSDDSDLDNSGDDDTDFQD